MRFFLNTENSEETGTALLSLGEEAGGEVVATLPYKTPVDTIRANMFALLPQAFEELEGIRQLWWYIGPMKLECPGCQKKVEVPCASDAQIGRLERLRMKMLDE